jgi:hypothetical protein
MQAIITAIVQAAKIIAKGLALPRRRVSSLGRPNIPLPIMQLMTRAVIVQRPIDLTNAMVHLAGDGKSSTETIWSLPVLSKTWHSTAKAED